MCVDEFHGLSNSYADLYSSLFDADPHTLSYIEQYPLQELHIIENVQYISFTSLLTVKATAKLCANDSCHFIHSIVTEATSQVSRYCEY